MVTRAKQSLGTCSFCGQVVAKSGIGRHLAACRGRRAAVEEAEQRKAGSDTLYRLRVEAHQRPEFWLELEMRGLAKLSVLDDYLRAIWLECCDHLSEFSIGAWTGNEIPMSRRAHEAFADGIELTHLYDFGTTSITKIKPAGLRKGKPLTGHPITLLARNVPPQYECIVCKEPATLLCMECLIEHGTWGALCDKHAKSHPHADYGDPIELVNSPRLGLCGYDGPAEPPY